MKMFQGEGEKVSLGRSGMHGEISPGPRSIEGEEQYRGEAITSRAKPSPCSLPAPLFSPSLHPSFNLDSSLFPPPAHGLTFLERAFNNHSFTKPFIPLFVDL